MDGTKLQTLPTTEKLIIELETNGPVASQAGPEVEALLQHVEPGQKGHFRPKEFLDEAVAEAQGKLRELAARSPQRDEILAKNPPSPRREGPAARGTRSRHPRRHTRARSHSYRDSPGRRQPV
jgi:hypothetical protein